MNLRTATALTRGARSTWTRFDARFVSLPRVSPSLSTPSAGELPSYMGITSPLDGPGPSQPGLGSRCCRCCFVNIIGKTALLRHHWDSMDNTFTCMCSRILFTDLALLSPMRVMEEFRLLLLLFTATAYEGHSGFVCSYQCQRLLLMLMLMLLASFCSFNSR